MVMKEGCTDLDDVYKNVRKDYTVDISPVNHRCECTIESDGIDKEKLNEKVSDLFYKRSKHNESHLSPSPFSAFIN